MFRLWSFALDVKDDKRYALAHEEYSAWRHHHGSRCRSTIRPAGFRNRWLKRFLAQCGRVMFSEVATGGLWWTDHCYRRCWLILMTWLVFDPVFARGYTPSVATRQDVLHFFFQLRYITSFPSSFWKGWQHGTIHWTFRKDMMTCIGIAAI